MPSDVPSQAYLITTDDESHFRGIFYREGDLRTDTLNVVWKFGEILFSGSPWPFKGQGQVKVKVKNISYPKVKTHRYIVLKLGDIPSSGYRDINFDHLRVKVKVKVKNISIRRSHSHTECFVRIWWNSVQRFSLTILGQGQGQGQGQKYFYQTCALTHWTLCENLVKFCSVVFREP